MRRRRQGHQDDAQLWVEIGARQVLLLAHHHAETGEGLGDAELVLFEDGHRDVGVVEQLEQLLAREALNGPARDELPQDLGEARSESRTGSLRGALVTRDVVRDLLDLDPTDTPPCGELAKPSAIEGRLHGQGQQLYERGQVLHSHSAGEAEGQHASLMEDSRQPWVCKSQAALSFGFCHFSMTLADDAICIGPGPAVDSYLKIDRIIAAAEIAQVDAIHPGFGFLSENSKFAHIVRECDFEFIGPSEESMDAVGNKDKAKQLAKKAKVPIVPGSDGLLANEEEALVFARKVGFPVLIKAAAGGGGRGMRVARDEASLVVGFSQAKQEAEAAFKDGSVYLEKYVEQPRHIEVQLLGDKHGNLATMLS